MAKKDQTDNSKPEPKKDKSEGPDKALNDADPMFNSRMDQLRKDR